MKRTAGLAYRTRLLVVRSVRNAIAETQASGLEALLGTAVRGLEVWVDFFFLAANRNWKF